MDGMSSDDLIYYTHKHWTVVTYPYHLWQYMVEKESKGGQKMQYGGMSMGSQASWG